MPYYSVVPLSPARQERYTYRAEAALPRGSVVRIRFGRRQDLGIVWDPAEPHPKAAVAEETGVVVPGVPRELAVWASREYLAPLGVTLKLVVNKQVIQYAPTPPAAASTVRASPPRPARETREKAAGNSLLLIGPARRERYRELLADARRGGSSALVIVPEVNLTPQTVAHYGGTPAETVAYHSRLTPKQRAVIWWRIAAGEPITVVGTRSALWLPWQRLGVVVLDEEDDPNYKQEQTPRYHARPVAAKLAKLTGARLVCGSVAPSLEAYNQAAAGNTNVEVLPQRLPQLRLTASPEHGRLLGYELWDAVRTVTEAAGLAVLYAPTFLHERLQAELAGAFPASTVAVFTPEQRVGSAQKVLRNSKQGKIGIIVGGPGLGRAWGFAADVVGVVDLDYLLQLPDFRTTERTFGLLKKLSGLVTAAGELVIQTGVADHPVLTALRGPYETFAAEELSERRLLGLPPAVRLTRILFAGAERIPAQAAAEAAAACLRSAGFDATVSTAAVPLRNGQHRCQVLIKGAPAKLAPHLDPGWNAEVDPVTLL